MIEVNLLERGKKKSFGGAAVSQVQMPDIGQVFGKMPSIINFGTILSVLGVVGISLYTQNLIRTQREALTNQLTNLRQEVSVLEAKKQKLAQEEKQIDILEKEISSLQAKIRDVNSVFRSRVYPVPKLDAISQTIPKFVWLDSLSYRLSGTSGQIQIEGSAITNDALSDFLSALQEFPGFKDIALGETIHREETDYSYKKFKLTFKTQESPQ